MPPEIKNGFWYGGLAAWIFGLCDRTYAALADGFLSPVDLILLFTASFFFVSWLILRPENQ